MEILHGFAPLAARYDGFIIDLWGVIHDGVTPLPGAVDCLIRLHEAKKRVVLLSNAPRRSAAARAAMRAMGIPDHLYDALVTSGEATHQALRNRASGTDPFFATLGPRVFHLGPDRDRNVLDGLDLIRTETPDDADFVLNTGPDDHRQNHAVADFEDILQDCAQRRLPMICANPDLEVIRGGTRVICAGALAARYVELGAPVRSIGKPDPTIYTQVQATLGTPKAKTLAIGDALRTDIAGAHAAGVDSCWVLGGIHHESLIETPAGAQAASAGCTPTACIPAFVW